MMSMDATTELIGRWRNDTNGAYRSWFLWHERIKNFRSIRRGLKVVIEQIAAVQFGGIYRGSSLKIVVASITEQGQIFKSAGHAFLWNAQAAHSGYLKKARAIEIPGN